MDNLSPALLWDVLKHIRSWLANLSRAGTARKEESKKALRGVVKAARETAAYMRRMQDTGSRDHGTEGRLAVLWTELGFALQDLGIAKLAKRCQISGKQWSEPGFYDEAFVEKADISLERMEAVAMEILNQIED
jgi:hypothetical protein